MPTSVDPLFLLLLFQQQEQETCERERTGTGRRVFSNRNTFQHAKKMKRRNRNTSQTHSKNVTLSNRRNDQTAAPKFITMTTAAHTHTHTRTNTRTAHAHSVTMTTLDLDNNRPFFLLVTLPSCSYEEHKKVHDVVGDVRKK